MRRLTIIAVFAVFYTLCCFGKNSFALQVSGYAETIISNIAIEFSDINAVNVERKGMYPMELNGTHASSAAGDYFSGNYNKQIVGNGTTTSISVGANSSAGVLFTDIAPYNLTNNIYSDITYSAFASGYANLNSYIRSYSVINDIWFFSVNSPVNFAISFDYYTYATGEIINQYGNLITETVIGLGVGRQDWLYYSPDCLYNDGGVVSGTISMSMSYEAGDSGSIYLWTGSDVLANQYLKPDPVPEPSTMLLIGAGLMSYAGFGRKRRKNY